MENLEDLLRIIAAQQVSTASTSGNLDQIFSDLMVNFSNAYGNKSKFEHLVFETERFFKNKHSNLLKEWDTIRTNAERFKFFAKLLGYFPLHGRAPYSSLSHVPACRIDKNNMPSPMQEYHETKSKLHRKEGNEKFVSGQLSSALNDYNACIAFAPNLECLSMGYANRSAVLLKMDQPLDSLASINLAFQNSYPQNLKYKLHFRQAQCMQKLGHDAQAMEYFHTAWSSLHNATDIPRSEKEQWITKIEKELSRSEKIAAAVVNEVPATAQSAMKVPVLTYAENKELPCATEGVVLKFNNKRGRHLIATRDLKLGDVVLVEKAVAAVGVNVGEHRWLYCNNCFQRSQNLIPCNYCSNVMFCSEECKHLSAAAHSIECQMLPPLLTIMNSEDLVDLVPALLLPVLALDKPEKIISLSQESELQNASHSKRERGFIGGQFLSNLQSIFSLESNIKIKSLPDCIKFGVLSVVIVELMKNLIPPSYEMGGAVFNLLNILSTNCREILETYRGVIINLDRYTMIGKGIFPTYALLNHSCDPNVAMFSHGNTIVARVIKPIIQGEEIVTSYGLKLRFQYETKASRKISLSQYHFTCECEACVNDWPLRAKLPFLPKHVVPRSLKNHIAISAAKVEPHKVLFVSTDIISEEMIECYTNHVNLLYKAQGRLSLSYNECARGLEQYWHRQGNYYLDKWL